VVVVGVDPVVVGLDPVVVGLDPVVAGLDPVVVGVELDVAVEVLVEFPTIVESKTYIPLD
jgi:hypothetical protein